MHVSHSQVVLTSTVLMSQTRWNEEPAAIKVSRNVTFVPHPRDGGVNLRCFTTLYYPRGEFRSRLRDCKKKKNEFEEVPTPNSPSLLTSHPRMC
jgi:hypothetical protein